MKPRPSPISRTPRLRSTRAARLMLVALALGAAGLAFAHSSHSPSGSSNDDATGPRRERSQIPHASAGRRSGGLQVQPQSSTTAPATPGSLPSVAPGPGWVSPGPTGGATRAPHPGSDPHRGPGNNSGVQSPSPGPGTRSGGSGTSDTGESDTPGGAGTSTGTRPSSTQPAPAVPVRPIASSGTTTVVSPPTHDNQRPSGPSSPATPSPIDTTIPGATTTEVTTTTQPEPEPERDEANCPNLDLIAIGGVSTDAPAVLQLLAPRFRELAAAELAKPLLVCAKPLEFWRDLVIQRLVTAGQPDGALITATDGSSVVLRISEIDWTGYRLRFDGSPLGVNFLGYPVGYMTMGDTTVLRTTLGGLVSSRPDTIGIAVIGGAWDFWMAHGGPGGPMGMVTGQPQAAYGPTGGATPAERGTIPVSGASQDFANGWIFLPGVASDVEAAAQPAGRYEWHHESEYLDGPTDGIGHILQTDKMSYYVDPSGIRHWLRTTSAWSCARWNLNAPEIAVRGFVMADYALGSQFVCPN